MARDSDSARSVFGAAFWLHDVEPLSGRLRFAFYAGLLALLWTGTYRSPAFAAEAFAWTDPGFYTPVGIFSWTGTDWASPGLLRALAVAGCLALVCSALGLGRAVAPWIAAACWFVSYGVVQGAVGVTHRWHLAIYALWALCLARSADGCSLDEWLADRSPRWPRQNGAALLRTGFARKLVLVFAVATLFSGFVAKWLESGWAWADGATLYFEIARAHPRWPWLAEQILARPWLATALSAGSMALEALSPLALFSRRARHALVVAALGFHTGIMLLMSPRYFPQMWCYALLVDWGALAARLRGERPARVAPPVPRGQARAAAAGGALLCAALLAVAFARVEFWPLTHIPMYSGYRGPFGAFDAERARDEDQLRAFARSCTADALCAVASDWIELTLVARNGERRDATGRARIDARRGKTGVRGKQLWKRVRRGVARAIEQRPPGALAYDPDRPETAADRELRALVAPLRRSLRAPERWDRVEIVVHVGDEDVLLASYPLHASG